ncbi:MAG TPA: FtsX-like permease family protein [Bryobacteraceae bacterium]|nr:FtsX-like permease family protein [Bryobacteraceae bacterium]
MLAIILVATGLYGTISYSVARRTSELGIRMALGAERSQVLWMILRGGLALGAAGIGIGIPLVIVSSRILASLLYGVAPIDFVSIIAAVAGILGVVILAAYLPARRAAAVNPIVALRYE